MLKNIYQSNRNVWRGLMALLCIVCALLAPPAKVSAATKTAVLTFNGYTLAPDKYPADVTPVSLDCSDLEPFKGTYQPDYKSTVSAGDIIFKILSPNANADREQSKVVSITYTGKQALILVNQQFRFSPKEEGMAISDVTLFFREVGATANAYYENKLQTFTSEAPTLLTNEDMEAGKAYPFKKQEATFVAPYSQAEPYKGVFLQAAVITYDDGKEEQVEPIADAASATVSFVMPSVESNNATIVSVKNETNEVNAGDEIAEDADLTVVLKPSSNDEVITSVAYNGSDVRGDNSTTDGTWTGTIKYVSGAKFSVVTEKKTVDLIVAPVSNATIGFKNGSEEVESPVAIGTTLTVTVTPSANYVVNSVTYGGEPVSGTTAADGKWVGTITVKDGAELAVVTAIKTVSFTVPTVDNATVKIMNGDAEVGQSVAIGTQLTITVTPEKDYVVNSVIYNGKTIGTAGANGVWTGTFTVVEGGEFKISVTKKAVNFALPSITGVTAIVKNGNTELTTTTAIPVGTELSVELTPTDVSKKIATVTYAGASVIGNGTVSESGAWEGTIIVAEGATTLTATTTVKTFDVTVKDAAGTTVSFVNPSTGAALTMPVNYGTVVGIAVEDYALNMQARVTCTDKNGAVATGDGSAHCVATVIVKSDVAVTVTLAKATNAEVSFPSVTGGKVSVIANGSTISTGAMVPQGTTLSITLTPDPGYVVGSLKIEDKVIDLKGGNTASYDIPTDAYTVVISATFVKVYTVTWNEEVANGTIKVTYADDIENGLSSGVQVKGGEVLTVTLDPSKTDMITSLSATGATVATTATKNVYTVTVTADAVLTAYIGKELKNYNLVLQSATGGTVKVWDNAERTGTAILSGSGTKSIQEGTALYGTVTVSSGYTFGSLTLGNEDKTEDVNIETGNFIITMPGQAVYLTPTFNKIVPERTITVAIPEAQASMGSVSYQIGDATGICSAPKTEITAKQGDVITFTITANPNYRIKTAPSLTYSENKPDKKVGTYTVGTSNATLNITFEEIPNHSLTVNVSGTAFDKLPEGTDLGLSVKYNGSEINSNTKIPEGATVDFTLTAGDEYEITSFKVGNTTGTVNSNGSSATAAYTMTNSTSASVSYEIQHRMTAINFRLNSADITNMGTVSATYSYFNGKSIVANNSISPTTTTQTRNVPTATPVTVVVTPKSGYMVESLTINGDAINVSDYEGANHVVTVPNCWETPSASEISSAATTPSTNSKSRAGEGVQSVGALSVSVTFKEVPQYYSLNITATGGTVADKNKPLEVQYGTVTYSGVANLTDKVLKGTEVKITATPNTNYQIKSITINGKAQEFDITASSWSTKPPITITQNTTVAVVFEPRTYRVQVFASPAEGGDPYVGTKGTAVSSVSKGSRVTITAPANPGYKFVKWLLQGEEVKNGNALAGSTYTFTMPEADQRFTAVYETTKYTPHSVGIQIAAGQEDWGTIAIIYPRQADWTSWNSSSVFIKDWNQYVEVQAVANQEEKGRYYFDSWQISGAAAGTVTQSTAEDNLSSTINYGGNTNVTITAKFVKNYKVSVVAPVNGTVEVTTADGTMITPNHPQFVKPGTRVTVTMTSNKNYNVATLVVNDRETSRYNRPGTFSQTVTINEDTNLNALFYNPNGIEDIEADNAGAQQPEQWFTVQGRYVGTERPTQAGIYIRRCGSEAEKVVIR